MYNGLVNVDVRKGMEAASCGACQVASGGYRAHLDLAPTAAGPPRCPIPLSCDGIPNATADLPRSTRKGSASKLRPLG